MPYWILTNPNPFDVVLPYPLSGGLRAGTVRKIVTEAPNMDLQALQDMKNKGLLRIDQVEENPERDDKIEVPVYEWIKRNLVFKGPWAALTSYSPNDVVQYANTSWVALQPSLGVTPVEGPFWTALVNPTATGTGFDRMNIALAQITGRVWSVPEPFVHTWGGATIEIFTEGGRRLTQAPSADPRLGDYVPVESGGLGSGYDQIHMLTYTPKQLWANYKKV